MARLEPSTDAFPVFPTYDLAAQVRAMRLVGERTAVPVPAVRWVEDSPDVLGARFFVMDRVDGRVPPDVMPYPMGSWLSEASEEDQAALVTASAGVLAAIHATEASADELAFLDAAQAGHAGSSALARQFAGERAYYEWVRGAGRLPLIERAFTWLEGCWPVAADARPPVLCWGDARIGNILYQGFTPAAVLDWEMATLAPPELDLGWTIFMHRFFQDLAEDMGLPGMPDFLHRDDVVEAYVQAGGREPRDLDWFITYAAVRHGTIMVRVMGRQVFFGESEEPADREEFILHRRSLERMLDGAMPTGAPPTGTAAFSAAVAAERSNDAVPPLWRLRRRAAGPGCACGAARCDPWPDHRMRDRGGGPVGYLRSYPAGGASH